MEGVVIAFDPATQEGSVRTDSGEIYHFDLTGWRGRGLPDTGIEVSFEAAADGCAHQVFNRPSGQQKPLGTRKLGSDTVSVPWYKKLGRF